MELKPFDDRVVVEKIEEEEEATSGGIIIPDTAKQEKPRIGKVVAVGTDPDIQERADGYQVSGNTLHLGHNYT